MSGCNSFQVTKVYNGEITIATSRSGNASVNIGAELVLVGVFSNCHRNGVTVLSRSSYQTSGKLLTRYGLVADSAGSERSGIFRGSVYRNE